MAEFTEQQKKKLEGKFLKIGDRQFPIFNQKHAARTLKIVADIGTNEEKAEAKKKLEKEYPELVKDVAEKLKPISEIKITDVI